VQHDIRVVVKLASPGPPATATHLMSFTTAGQFPTIGDTWRYGNLSLKVFAREWVIKSVAQGLSGELSEVVIWVHHA
jgi:hypothetical protein